MRGMRGMRGISIIRGERERRVNIRKRGGIRE
jgi:hypothetical protein